MRTLRPRIADFDLERVLRRRVHLLECLSPRISLRRLLPFRSSSTATGLHRRRVHPPSLRRRDIRSSAESLVQG